MDNYAIAARYADGVQSAYNAGLSYFPDVAPIVPMPMGDYLTDAGAIGGGAIAGPAGAAAGSLAASVIQRWFGGSAVDQQRQDRVNYFAQLAVNGNVGAMQLILGGPSNVSGNEQTMWTNAANAIQQVNPGVVTAARNAGPVWLVNSGDTATNYPRMKAFAADWANQHPLTGFTSGVSTAISQFFTPTPQPMATPILPGQPAVNYAPVVPTSHGISPVVLLGGAAILGFVLLRRRRS